MGRRSFSREFKLEAVRLVRERGVSIAQAESEVAALVRALPNPNQTKRPVFLVSMRDQIVGKVRGALRWRERGLHVVRDATAACPREGHDRDDREHDDGHLLGRGPGAPEGSQTVHGP